MFQSGSKETQDNDVTYTRDFYNMNDHSISLLKSILPFTPLAEPIEGQYSSNVVTKTQQSSFLPDSRQGRHERMDRIEHDASSLLDDKSKKGNIKGERALNDEIDRLLMSQHKKQTKQTEHEKLATVLKAAQDAADFNKKRGTAEDGEEDDIFAKVRHMEYHKPLNQLKRSLSLK